MSQKAKATQRSVEVRRARVLMLQKDLTVRDLARRTGLDARRISNVLSGADVSWPPREAINSVLRAVIFLEPNGTRRRLHRPRRNPQLANDTDP